MNKKNRFINLMRLLIIVSFGLGSCKLFEPGSETQTPSTPLPGQTSVTPVKTEQPASTALPTPPFPLTQGPVFAVFNEQAIDLLPMLQQEAIASDLSNVRIPFVLSKTQMDRLASDGFVVSPGTEKEFFTIYEKARYDNLPVFVTSDSLLHVYHLMFQKVLRSAEVQYFIPLLRQLNQAMLAKVDEEYQTLRGTSWEDAARRVVAYFGVGSKLLDPNLQVPSYANDLVSAELGLIEQASGIMASPIFPGLEYGEDYTQYIPRGHYTRSEDLKAYFKSMMWYGRMTFRLKSTNLDIGRGETRSALLVVYALRNTQVNGKPALDAWSDLYSPTVFFVGRSDDLTPIQYGDVLEAVYGKGVALPDLATDVKLDQFINLAYQLPAPKILGIVIQASDDEAALTKGLRFMGQRFVPDAYIFRQLIYRNVGTQQHRRGFPKGLDLMATMGSNRAYQLLDQMGDTGYENYPQQMDKVKAWISGLSVADWTETLYNSWLYSFYPLLDIPGEGYPNFMRSTSWLDKQLNTSLGSWAELKHDTILYAKQVYAELGGGPAAPAPLPPKGYVEPVPRFFARIAALTNMTRTGLQNRGLLSDQDRQGLEKLEDLANALVVMSQKELRNEPLTDAEYERIRYYGGELENLTMLAAESESSEPGAKVYLDEEQQAAVIADVATDPDPAGDGSSKPMVLEEGVGRVDELYAVVPMVDTDGTTYLQVSRGGVFSYYEFPWPADDRLTDEKWRRFLDEGTASPLPSWTSSFFVSETENAEIGKAVQSFQGNVTYNYWDPNSAVTGGESVSLQPFLAEIQALQSAKQYVGHQLVSSQIRSFDLQSQTLAVVTVREIWQDKLYSYSGEYPNYDEQSTAQRGPYTMEVTYTIEYLQKDYGNVWEVTRVVYATPPPPWQ